MRSSLPLLPLLLLAGCRLYLPLSPAPAAPAAAPGRSFGALRIEVRGAGRHTEAWEGIAREQVLTGGWVQPGRQAPLLRLVLEEQVLPERLSELLHVLTLALYPSRARVRVRATAMAVNQGGLEAGTVRERELERFASLGLVFYPPAWGIDPGAEALEQAVREVTRDACTALAGLGQPDAPGATPPPAPAAQPASPQRLTCPGCGEPVEPGWVVCPRCETRLTGKR